MPFFQLFTGTMVLSKTPGESPKLSEPRNGSTVQSLINKDQFESSFTTKTQFSNEPRRYYYHRDTLFTYTTKTHYKLVSFHQKTRQYNSFHGLFFIAILSYDEKVAILLFLLFNHY